MQLEKREFRFAGAQTPGTSAGVGQWQTSTDGSATIIGAADGMVLTLDATSEVQNTCLYMGDVLNWDIDNLVAVDFWLKISATLPAAVTAAFGMATARNDVPESIASHASFFIAGAAAATSAVTVGTDDGTNDVTAVSAGVIATAFKRFQIDFASGLKTVSPPTSSSGGKSNVLFNMDDVRGNLGAVARGTAFDMSNFATGLQPYIQLQKTTGTAAGTLTLFGVDIHYKRPF